MNIYYSINKILGNFKNKNIETYVIAGNDFSTTAQSKIGDQTSQSNSTTAQTNVTNTTTTTTTDNSVDSKTTTVSNTDINSSQNIITTNFTDQSSVMDIKSSTDTYNYDQSSTLNSATSNTQNKIIQSCGTTIEEAQAVINIATDESVNTNINNGNVFINTGDNVSISNVRLESELNFLSSNVDKSCVLDAINDLQAELTAENDNSKSFAGGEGGDVGAMAGGNSTSNDNSASKDDSMDSSMTTDNSNTQKASTTATNLNSTESGSTSSTEQSSSQSASATASAGLGAGSSMGSGSMIGTIIFVIIIIIIAFLAFKNKDKLMELFESAKGEASASYANMQNFR